MPTNASGEVRRVDELLESSLDSVDRAEAETIRIAEEIGFDEEDLHKIGIAVREAMVNAVVHGNRYNAKKRVHFEVMQSPDTLKIRIGDEGEGFDRNNIPDPLAEENLLRHSGRGMLLVQAFMDEFLVEDRSPKGTQVTLLKKKRTEPS